MEFGQIASGLYHKRLSPAYFIAPHGSPMTQDIMWAYVRVNIDMYNVMWAR